ncbi:hypothetical protein GQ457_06G024170 [Hibiscus cannabinus]
METWFIIFLTISIPLLLKAFFNHFSSPKNLPPSPPTLPLIGNFLLLRQPFFQIEQTIRRLRPTLGPVLTLHLGPRPSIFIFDRSLAHQALIQNGALFSDRPKSLPSNKIMDSNQHSISSGSYGPLWRLLRRNLTSEILHPSRVKSYAHARKWVLDILLNGLQQKAESGDPVEVLVHFRHAILRLLVLMCFGDKLSEEQIKEIGSVQRRVLTAFGRFRLINFWPRVTKVLLRKQWEQLFQLRNDLENVMTPLIRARKEAKGDGSVFAYVDTLLDLELPDENRKLEEKEIVTLASEFINGGTDTTTTALQWIMANLVKHPRIQDRLLVEIKGVVGDANAEEIKQDDLQKMPYLKAVVLEGLRRHPPVHFVLPHCVTEDTVLGGYLIPKKGAVNFMVVGSDGVGGADGIQAGEVHGRR